MHVMTLRLQLTAAPCRTRLAVSVRKTGEMAARVNDQAYSCAAVYTQGVVWYVHCSLRAATLFGTHRLTCYECSCRR